MTVFCYKLFLIKINLHFLLFHLSAAKATYTCSTRISSDALMLDVLFLLYHTVAARGYLPPVANVFVAAPTPAVRSPVDILMVTMTALVWTVNSTLSWTCNYVMQWDLG